MNEWQEVKLKEICKFKYGSNLPANSRIEGNYPVYGSSSIVSRHIDYYVKGPGIIVGRKGTVGKVQYSPTDFFPIDTTYYIEHNLNKVDLKFLYYRLQISGLDTMNSDAAVPGLNRIAAINQRIDLPPLPVQQKIAKILSNYDDLIENNLKRIKLLEESARLTYEEWFLRFRIDGKKLDIDPATGLPFGWEKVKLKSFCILTMGQSPKSEFYNQTCEGLPFHQGVTNYGFRFPSNTTWSTEGSRIAEEGDILFSVRAPVGRLNVSIEKIILGRGLASIRQINNLNSFLFYQLQNIFFEDNLMGSGVIFDSVTKRDVEDIELIYSKNISEEFNTLTSTIDNEIKNLTNQNKFLKEARDILLPRLMTGMIDTDELDIAV
jgi:type I restriction enzyme, S subunit